MKECPKCGGTLKIAAQVWINETDDGAEIDEDDGSFEYTDAAHCICKKCKWEGSYGDASKDLRAEWGSVEGIGYSVQIMDGAECVAETTVTDDEAASKDEATLELWANRTARAMLEEEGVKCLDEIKADQFWKGRIEHSDDLDTDLKEEHGKGGDES